MVVFLRYSKVTAATVLVTNLIIALGDIIMNGLDQGKEITGSMAIVARLSKREEIRLPNM
jgi:hypothetical protein